MLALVQPTGVNQADAGHVVRLFHGNRFLRIVQGDYKQTCSAKNSIADGILSGQFRHERRGNECQTNQEISCQMKSLGNDAHQPRVMVREDRQHERSNTGDNR